MRRPYNIPFVSITRERDPSPLPALRRGSTFRRAQEPGAGSVNSARRLTKGDRPVAPTQPLMPTEAPSPQPSPSRGGGDRRRHSRLSRVQTVLVRTRPSRGGKGERFFAPTTPRSSQYPGTSAILLYHAYPSKPFDMVYLPPRHAQDTLSSRPRRLGDRRPPPSRKSQRWPGFKLRQALVSGRTAVVPIWCRGTAAMLVPTWPRLAGGSSGHLLGPGPRRTA